MGTRTKRITPLIMLALCLLFTFPANAQQSPEVEVDTSVLDDLEQYRSRQGYGRGYGTQSAPTLSRPVTRLEQPSLTAPEPVKLRPPESMRTEPVKPEAVTKPVETEPVTPIYVRRPKPEPKLIPAPPPTTEALLKAEPVAPIPAKKPYRAIPAIKVEEVLAAQPTNVPIPQKRPDSLSVTSSFVEKKKAEPAKTVNLQNKKTDMPALPAGAVDSEMLTEEVLLEPKPKEVLKSIEKPVRDLTDYGNKPVDIKPKNDLTLASAPEVQVIQKSDGRFILEFPQGETELDGAQQNALKDSVLQKLSSTPALRLQIQAYASPADNSQSSARRVSLTRALSVRSWLVEKGIEPSRMDVRALGTQTNVEPLDRIDLVFLSPAKG